MCEIASNYDPCQGRSISLITCVNPLPGWGHGWTRRMTPPISIFPNEINALGDFRGGVKVACDFAAWVQPRVQPPTATQLPWSARASSSIPASIQKFPVTRIRGPGSGSEPQPLEKFRGLPAGVIDTSSLRNRVVGVGCRQQLKGIQPALA